MGTRLELAYFDQHRDQLAMDKTVRENISEGHDHINVRGRSRHVISYLKDFLFPPDRIDSPVRILSGGERNRLLLAKVLAQPANVLVLDEPTNDLDVDTLELLEELLADYDGTLLLVSHDRTFLDNVVTSTLVFEGDGMVGEYVGGYEDWLRQRKPRASQTAAPTAAPAQAEKPAARENRGQGRQQKLSYKDQRELDSLPARIEALESEQQGLEAQVSRPEFYQQDKDAITAVLGRLEQVQAELARAYARWEELEVSA
jgi:ATP-binding cassette subfamily F protein uup